MSKLLVLAVGGGAAQYVQSPHTETLTGGFPEQPWPNQRRPGADGRCSNQEGLPERLRILSLLRSPLSCCRATLLRSNWHLALS
jgi:hypothetical protein